MNYRTTTSDGKKRVVSAGSAAAAIEGTRWLCRGLIVTGCYSGLKHNDAELIRLMDMDARPIVGWIDHEVPAHEPVPVDAIKPKARITLKDESVPMFDDEKIKEESRLAKDKFDYEQPISTNLK